MELIGLLAVGALAVLLWGGLIVALLWDYRRVCRRDEELHGEREPGEESWNWPARATGPIAEAHMGKVRLAHDRPGKRAA